MALGFKLKKVKFNKGYTIEELFDVIKDREFEAGRPSIERQGFGYLISFPALDSQNQVQVFPATMKKQPNVYQVLKGEEAGLNRMFGNDLNSIVFDEFFGFRNRGGKNKKTTEQLVEVTARELEAMGL